MSGISGAWHLDGRPIDRRVLSEMAARMRHRGPDGERSRIDGSAGFSCQHLWVAAEDHGTHQPIVGESGAMLVMDGRLDNRDELVAALTLDRRVSDARVRDVSLREMGRRLRRAAQRRFRHRDFRLAGATTAARTRCDRRAAPLLFPHHPPAGVRVRDQSAARAS